MRSVTTEETRIRILMPDEYNTKSWSFFGVYKGSSWHQEDAKAIFWLGQHWMLVTFSVILVLAGLYVCGFYIYRRLYKREPVSPLSRGSCLWPWPCNPYGYNRLPKHEV
jgi:mannosyltransferase OCH1-like enzyme